MTQIPTLADIKETATRIAPFAERTPVRILQLDDGTQLWLKCENLQRTGAFKFRGACNAVFSLSDEEAARGVATHSSGNHAAALACAAELRGILAHVVMPKTTTEMKKNNVQRYSHSITLCEPTLKAREETLQKVLNDTGAIEIHPYNNLTIIAGQGTAALEFLDEIPDLDILLTPVGGGGLLSGTAIATKETNSSIKVIGTEPTGADDAYRSFRSGKIIPSVNPQTICDGLLTSLGEFTFAAIQHHVDDIITISEEAIKSAMKTVREKTGMSIEPSAAVPIATILEGKVNPSGKKVGIIISGGNVD
ncbi:MAG TPA: pyridoxal-phosphate dependent enzyme [Candidatus Marinimicrobia bacterium]|nr:pyridoxal-phosphate dependent enzyme [Candidatus Neomarinimicrobiota bacterium]